MAEEVSANVTLSQGNGRDSPLRPTLADSTYPGVVTTTDVSVPKPASRRVLLAKPRGYCAGVDRAVQAVEKALEQFGAPVYVRKQIVHNTHVVSELEKRGAIFVEETDEVPAGARRGVLRARRRARGPRRTPSARGLHAIDATCPLVTKVHNEARRFAARTTTSC